MLVIIQLVDLSPDLADFERAVKEHDQWSNNGNP